MRFRVMGAAVMNMRGQDVDLSFFHIVRHSGVCIGCHFQGDL